MPPRPRRNRRSSVSDAFYAAINRSRVSQHATRAAAEQEIQRLEMRIRRILDLLLDRDDPPRSQMFPGDLREKTKRG
jgi:hypothetical protein